MLLLVTTGHPQIEERLPNPHLGRLVQPRHYWRIKDTAEAGVPWAADNDAFQGWDDAAAARYVQMLDAMAGLDGCLFVTLPDVVGDAKATAVKFSEWLPALVSRGLPVGFVAQDGIEEVGVPWDKIDALFLGGTDAFKLGERAEELVTDAKARGKWVHMGRVNGAKRVRYAKTIGCDSFDGSSFSRWRDIWLPTGLDWAAAPAQMKL